jgi:hypothetical protein
LDVANPPRLHNLILRECAILQGAEAPAEPFLWSFSLPGDIPWVEESLPGRASWYQVLRAAILLPSSL